MKRDVWRNPLAYIARAVVLGLAVAFVLTRIWPQLIAPTQVVEKATRSQPATYPDEGPVSYATAVQRAAPAVVNINTAKVVAVRPYSLFDDPIFREFFGRGFDDLITPKKRVETSLGSGVVMAENGYVITSYHVIREADAIQVSLRDGRMAAARVIGTDVETDIAVLKIDLDELPVISLGDSEALRVGDVVLAIGNPFGVGQTVTMGIVGATGRKKLGINTFENFIQTDAAINPGNSGGALVDAHGNLIGINSAIFSRSGGSQGIGFAIPVGLARTVLQEIIQYGRPIRGWLGIEANTITPEFARRANLNDIRGVVVVGILRNGPAHKAGLRPGDIIVAIDGEKIDEARDALFVISSRKPGSNVRLSILRDGKALDLRAVAIERPANTRGTG